MRTATLLAAVALTTIAQPLFAQEPGPARGGAAAAAGTAQLIATVEAIDAAVRTLTLKGSNGNVQTLGVGDELRNLLQVKVGDRVVVTYAQALALQLKKVGAEIRERVGREGGASAAPGARPATVVGREIALVGDVVAVNYVKQTLTLRGANQTVRLVVPDAVQLKTITTGDQVHAIYTEALALAVKAAHRTAIGE